MSFDWPQFLSTHRIEYRDHGANVGKDHIVTHCPLCGPHDPSMHMSISLAGHGWRCFRDHAHSGITPTRLIQALTGCTWEQAYALAGNNNNSHRQYVQPQTLQQRVVDLLSPAPPAPPIPVEWPPTSRPLDLDSLAALPYRLYLRGRGIADLTALAGFDIRYDARDPRWHGRILFGIHHQSRLVAITGRAISQRAEPRYLADGGIDEHLIWADRMPAHGRMLVLTEGPFDALKVNLLGNRLGIWSTCAMTSDFSPAQRARLYDLYPRFDRTVVLFDHGNEVNAWKLARGTARTISAVSLPPYAADPAELTSLDWLLADEDEEEDSDA